MKTRTRIPVKDLQRGMSFDMFKTECLTVNAKKNKLGFMVVHFVKITEKKFPVRHLVVPPNFTVKNHQK